MGGMAGAEPCGDGEHRRILRQALLGTETVGAARDFKEYLLAMPDVGEDSDFSRIPGATVNGTRTGGVAGAER